MDDVGSPIIGISVFVVLIIVTGMIAAYRKAVEDHATEKNSKTAQVLLSLLSLIIGVYEIDLFAGIIMESFFQKGISIWMFLGIYICLILIVLLLCTISIFTGQKIAGAKEKQCEKIFTPMVHFMSVIFTPILGIADILANQIARIFGVDPNLNTDDVTEEEIISMVNEGHEHGVLKANEAEMITNIFEFGDKEAQDIMTHRKNMDMLSADETFCQAMDDMLQGNNSRFPVFLEDVDNIIGVVHIKDVMLLSRQDGIYDRKIKDIEGLVRGIDFIPETRNISALFQSMQLTKSHMVIVVDEYGQTTGLVTMEDILEEIVGNIMDEYDEDETMFVKEADGSYTMSGMTPLEDIQDELGIAFEPEDFDTLNGFLISEIDTIPKDGMQYEVPVSGYNFKVVSVENKTIQTVHVTKIKETDENKMEVDFQEQSKNQTTD
ncbi:MAG: hemolysin family protein [Lachnospiraceae bacterium]